MSLFGFGKKKQEEPQVSSCCYGASGTEQDACCCCCASGTGQDACCGASAKGILSIKVLGAGCKSCHALYENTQAAVKAMGLDVAVEYITDMEKVMTYGVMSMPALVVNEKAVSTGRVLKAADVEKLLRQLGG